MTTEGHVGPLLATMRELDDVTRRSVEAHLTVCAECRAAQAAYARQDAVLSGLPILPASPRLGAAVRARIAPVAQPTLRPAWLGRVATILAAVAIIAAASASTIAVSAQALPGDLLYPVKRTVEQVALTVLSVPQQQAAYEDALAERRRFEARQVLELKRDVPLEFAGALQHTDDGGWAVGGIPVALDPLALEEAGVAAGDAVTVSGEAQRGQLRVLTVNRERRRNEEALPAPTPSATATSTHTSTPAGRATESEVRPVATSTPLPAATATEPPTATPTATEPAATPTAPMAPSPTASPEPPFPRRTPLLPRRTALPSVPAPTPTDTPDWPGRPRLPSPTDPRPPRLPLPSATLGAPSPTPAATDAATPTREARPTATPAPTETPRRPRPPLPSPPPWPTRRR